jgi:hypothetical protein
MYPVRGKIELPGGDPAALVGSTIEVASESDPSLRAAGEIQADGGFALETLSEGAMRKGAREGTYRGRIVLADEDAVSHKRAAQAVAPRFLKFESAGLAVQVPPPGEVVLRVAPR